MTAATSKGSTSRSGDSTRPDLAEVVLTLHEGTDPSETVERIIQSARSAIGCDDAGVMIAHSRRRVEALAATNDAVRRAHEAQVELGEGPCLDALDHVEAVFHLADARTDARWPRWTPEVLKLGYVGTVSVPLATTTRRFGSLNVYAREADAFTEDDLAVMALLGRHASASLAATRDIEGLRKAVDARKVIGVAMGLIMERYGVDSDRAFDVLRRLSQAQNVKLRDVARQVVERRGLPNE